MKNVFLWLLLLWPVAVGAHLIGVSPLAVFILCAAAIIPLAKFIGDATEELAAHAGPGIGGLLNATFGNATELIIGIFALQAGLLEVVKASITGSILGNLLFVLGLSMLLGGRNRERQHFNATAAKANGTMLMLATTALVIPAIFLLTSPSSLQTVENLSVLVSVLMMIAYLASLLFSLHTHKHLYRAEAALIEPQWSVRKSVTILFITTAAIAFVSEILVSTITPLVTQFGWTELFIGVIVVAIVGNAAEHLSAVTAAMKDKMDLAIHISIGSASQIVMFVAPALVLISLLFPTPMSLVFNLFELAAIIFAVFVTNSVVEDGESTWFEGFQLLIAYIIMAVAFFLHP